MKTTVVNKNSSAFDVYIGRPSLYGNPFAIGPDGTRKQVLQKFQQYFDDRMARDTAYRKAVLDLKGKRLGCFCKPRACHGDIYVAYLEPVTTPLWQQPKGATNG